MTVYKFPDSPLIYVRRDGGFYPLSPVTNRDLGDESQGAT